MFTAPTVEHMVRVGIDGTAALKIRDICKDDRRLSNHGVFFDNIEALEKDYPETVRWVRQCYNMPSEHEVRMSMINEVMGGYGTEALDEDPNWFPQPHYSYVNMGDTYTPTIIYDHEATRFLTGCWGDIAEKFETQEA